MANTNYLPTREAELLVWAQNFKDKLVGSPAAYGLTEAQVEPVNDAFGEFQTALAMTQNPATRTKPNIATKNNFKKAMLESIRLTVGTIQNWPNMTDAKRDDLRIPVRDRQPTPVPVPEDMPTLRIAKVSGRLLDLDVLDGENQKRKPVGARSAWLWTFVATADQPNPPAELTAWQFRGGTTRSNPQVLFEESVEPGAKVWVTAQWVNPRDMPGPACAPQMTRIGWQGLSEAA